MKQNQSIVLFGPRAGVSLQTQHFPLYPLSAFLFVSAYSPFTMMLSIISHFLLPQTFFPFTIPYRASFSRQFLLSQWPSQFIFLFFISCSIILPFPTLSSTTAFLFRSSILHAPSISISTSKMFLVFARSVILSRSLHHTTLHSTQSTSLVSSIVLFQRARRKCSFSC